MSTALNEEQITKIASYEGIDPGLVRSISDAAVAHDVPPTMLLAVAKRETDFGRGAGYDAATGLGDGGHGHGMFQLDDRTPAHAPLLAQVQNDPAKAADVAASMLSESLSDGHPPLDALHIYNHGSLGGSTTSGLYHGKTVHYETAVAGWQHDYDVAAGLAPPTQAREQRAPATPAEQTFVNARIAEAAEKMRGMSTRDAQTHHPELENGNVACAYSVNKVLETALGRTYGENREYVPSLMADLRRNGTEVAAKDVQPGDIAIKLPSHGERHGHIGIVTAAGDYPRILNNSSSHGSLTNEDTPAQFSRNYVTKRDEDAVVYLRIDPASVDLAKMRATPIPEHVLGPDNAPPNPTTWVRDGKAIAPAQPRRIVDDLHARNDTTIHGELRNGKLQETPAELKRKNEIIDEAIRDAKAGKTLDFRFSGNGRESGREVARQNEKLDRAIENNLPAGAKAERTSLEDHTPHPAQTALQKAEHAIGETAEKLVSDIKHWTPNMDFLEFGKLMSKVRGGPTNEPAKPAVERAQDRGNSLER